MMCARKQRSKGGCVSTKACWSGFAWMLR
jgi:hypothetical protein